MNLIYNKKVDALMTNAERPAFQNVDVPVSNVSLRFTRVIRYREPMAFIDTLRSHFQLILSAEDVLTLALRMWFGFAIEFNKSRLRNDLAEPTRGTKNFISDSLELVLAWTPDASAEETSAGFD